MNNNDIDYDFLRKVATLTEEEHQSLIKPKIIYERIEEDPTVINISEDELDEWMMKNNIIEVTNWYQELLMKT